MSPNPAANHELSAKAAQVLYTYARAVDEGDLDTLERIAYEDVSLTRVDGTKHGREAFLNLYRGFKAANEHGSKHVITNVQAFTEDGNTIRAKAYFAATMFDADGTRIVIGQYDDSMRDDGDGLKYVHKRITVERVVQLGSSTAEWTGVTPKAAA